MGAGHSITWFVLKHLRQNSTRDGSDQDCTSLSTTMGCVEPLRIIVLCSLYQLLKDNGIPGKAEKHTPIGSLYQLSKDNDITSQCENLMIPAPNHTSEASSTGPTNNLPSPRPTNLSPNLSRCRDSNTRVQPQPHRLMTSYSNLSRNPHDRLSHISLPASAVSSTKTSATSSQLSIKLTSTSHVRDPSISAQLVFNLRQPVLNWRSTRTTRAQLAAATGDLS